MSYQSLSVREFDSKFAHGADDGQQTLNGVGIDDRTIVNAFLLTVPSLVDNFHLFDYRRFAALTGT